MSRLGKLSYFMPIAKIDETKRTVSGYASTEAKDSDGEIIKLDAIKAALPDYMEYGNIREMHRLNAVGVAEEANVDKKGLWLTAKISDDAAWKKVLDKVYKGFSIGGRKVAKVANEITELVMNEISLVDRPSNPECKFEIAKRKKDEPQFALAEGFTFKPAKLTKAEKFAIVARDVLKAQAAQAPLSAGNPINDAHNVTTKREYSDDQRKEYAASGVAMPGGRYPIPDKDALSDAISAYGRGKGKKQVKAHIKTRAAALGATDMLPEKWKKSKTGDAAGTGEDDVGGQAIVEKAMFPSNFELSAKPSFLTLTVGESGSKTLGGFGKVDHDIFPKKLELGSSFRKGGKRRLEKGMSAAGSLAYCFDSVKGAMRSLMMEAEREGGDKKDAALAKELSGAARTIASVISQKAAHEGEEALDFSDADDKYVVELIGEGFAMAANNTNLNKLAGGGDVTLSVENALSNLFKRASTPTRAARMEMCKRDMKKADKARKEAKDEIENVHKMIKAHYIAKADYDTLVKARGGKKPDDKDDGPELDMEKVLGGLTKAYGALNKVKTFSKAAGAQLAKAARSGQRGQEAGDGESGVYEVPPGVKDLSPSTMASAGPGRPGGGGRQPPEQMLDENWANKLAKRYGGQLPVEIVEIMTENAKLNAQLQLVNSMPGNGGGQRPYAMDLTKFAGNQWGDSHSRNALTLGGGNDNPEMRLAKAVRDSGVNPRTLGDNEQARSKVIGTFMMDRGNGRSLFDPDFKGAAGGRS